MRQAVSLEDFKKEIDILGNGEYEFLKELEPYKNKKSRVLLKHKVCGYDEWETNRDNFVNRKNRCPLCGGNITWKYSSFQKYLSKKFNGRFQIVDPRFVNTDNIIKTKEDLLILDNNCHHCYTLLPNHLVSRNNELNCKICGLYNKEITTKKFQNEIDEVSPNDKYTLLEDYIDTHTPILIRHEKCGYEYKVSRTNFLGSPNREGRRCPKCSLSNQVSKEEENLLNWIKSFYKGKIIENDRKILKGKELDIYFPDLKIAIEYDGLYYHSEEHCDKNYHLNKTEKCEKLGIQLIHIFSDEWDNKREFLKKKIKHILHCNNNEKIYARKCYIEEITVSDKNQFLEENHIQGKDISCLNLGLWYPTEDGDRLVSVMTFRKPSKALGHNSDSKYDYELSRFASDIEYNVLGGFSKLFSYFKNNYEWNNIITYADRRWSIGNVYIVNGFNLDHISKPNYWYLDNSYNTRYYRFKFRKQELKKLFPDSYSDDKTEFEIMSENGYTRIWDCGNLVFTYSK